MANNKMYSFSKEERLCSRKDIDLLYTAGSSFFIYPFKVLYSITEDNADKGPGVRVLLSVGKKRFRKAVERNRIRRLMREAYRLNKHILLMPANAQLHVAISYVGKEVPVYTFVSKKILACLERMVEVCGYDK